MSTFDPFQPRPARVQMVASSGVTVVVHEASPPEPAEDPPPPEPVQRLVVRVPDPPGRGRDALFARLFLQHGDFILQALRRRRDVLEESAKDLRQRVLLVLCQRLKGEEPIENVRGFLHEVIKNEVYNHNRRAKLDIEPDADADEEPCAALDPEEAVALAQRWEKLEGYVERLSDVEAEVFKCADLEGLTIDATAEKLGRPRGTVATQLARARSKLEAFVEESERGGTLGGDGDKR